MKKDFDVVVIGAGPAGIIASITLAREAKKVLLLEKLPKIALKLKATGGGRCNLTNMLSNEEFITRFGKDGRFMRDALDRFDKNALIEFFKSIGVDTHAPDGFRVFPTSHSSSSILSALELELNRLDVTTITSSKVEEILVLDKKIQGVKTKNKTFLASNVILATGGLGYPSLGAEGDGYKMAQELKHKVEPLYPAMMPLKTKESWVERCRADTIAKVELKVDIKKFKKLKANGDLIFTKDGIRGPVVLDFAREVTPLLEKYKEVPILLNLTKGMNEDEILKHLKVENSKNSNLTMLDLVSTLLPKALSKEICNLANINIDGISKSKLIKYLASTPLTIVGNDGFKMAMITRGGVRLKEIDPKTMQSKLIDGLYFCGEVVNLDGPCGGYNLQWSFSSGYLAGKSI